VTIHLIDTPGFDDSNRSDTEILQSVSTWFAETYRSGFKLSGIIYLHKINENKMGRSALLNLAMFRRLCGDDCLPNVVFVTTMWDAVMDKEECEAREMELKGSAYWGPLLDMGARSGRYYGGFESALEIVGMVKNCRKIVLDIQKQIVEQGQRLADTPAGKSLDEELRKKEEQYKRDLDIQKELMEAMIREREAENDNMKTKIRDREHEIRHKDEEIRQREEAVQSKGKEFDAELEKMKTEREALQIATAQVLREKEAKEALLAATEHSVRDMEEKTRKIQTEREQLQASLSKTQSRVWSAIAFAVAAIVLSVFAVLILWMLFSSALKEINEKHQQVLKQYQTALSKAEANQWIQAIASASTLVVNGMAIYSGAALVGEASSLFTKWLFKAPKGNEATQEQSKLQTNPLYINNVIQI